jgi:hypothetical protein
MMGLAVPFEDTLVKKPDPADFSGALVTWISDGVGEVKTFQTLTELPPLLTTLPAPSLGSTK